jgi:hypothetical protein
MDSFEKQQRIDVINGIIKVRWFIASIIIGLGFILKTKYFGGGWGVGFGTDILSVYLKIGIFGAIVFIYNFIFWLFMRSFGRQPIEKISDRFLRIMSFLQIIPDQIMFAVDFYFVGTVDTMAFMYFFLSLLFSGSLYRTRGIVLTSMLVGFLFTFICVIEYLGLIPHFPTYPGVTFFGNLYILRSKIVSFISYIGIVTFASVFLSNLIRNRESRLRLQRDKLSEQTHILSVQTQELTQAHGEIQGALTRSDVARRAATQARDEMEKANLELKKNVDELEKFYKITVGREVRIAELKEKNKELEKEIKKIKE